MAFTAGSVELAKANKLGSQLANLFSTSGFGLSGAIGRTGAQMIERYAKKLGFGITGLTTGNAFPPFGTIYPGLFTNSPTFSLEAALQNPRGTTLPNGITVGASEGQTVGIFVKKFVRTGADYETVMYYGVTLGATLSPGANGLIAFGLPGGITLDTGDRINFGSEFSNQDFAVVSNARGYTLSAGATKGISFASVYAGATKSPGTSFIIETIGVNSYTGVATGQPNNTARVAGTTLAFGSTTNGQTATIYFAGGTWSVN